MKLYLSLGSNIGNRQQYLLDAVSCLDEELCSQHSALSSFIETEAWGFDGPAFINAVVEYDLPLQDFEIESFALNLLDICKSIEKKSGRETKVLFDADGNRIYSSRTIDIDILLIGDYRIEHPRLKVPHPLMEQRDFVMIPLNELKNRF